MDFENKEQQESGLSLVDIFNIIKNSWLMILFFTLLIGALTFFYVGRYVEDRYKSTSELLVQVPVSGGQIDSNTLINSQRLLETASEFAKSSYIISKVRTEYSNFFHTAENEAILNAITDSTIVKNISVSYSNTSFIIKVSYSHENADFAQIMTDALTQALMDEEDVEMFKDTFIVLSRASDPMDDSPNRILFIIIGLMGGAIVGVGLAFVKHLFNNSYMTREQLEQGTGIQVIGVIPEFEMKEGRSKWEDEIFLKKSVILNMII